MGTFLQRFFGLIKLLFPEQERKAPHSGNANEGVDDAGENGGASATDPSHQIKL